MNVESADARYTTALAIPSDVPKDYDFIPGFHGLSCKCMADVAGTDDANIHLNLLLSFPNVCTSAFQ